MSLIPPSHNKVVPPTPPRGSLHLVKRLCPSTTVQGRYVTLWHSVEMSITLQVLWKFLKCLNFMPQNLVQWPCGDKGKHAQIEYLATVTTKV